ncbi:MAG: NADP-dependent malic enzyme [Anaerolineae bacterium]|jgi:malate dehydrogenase (oxaloacetate-decarboxylating)(NADP+)|nr:NADP-dependent malic enzyme [Anaerolineae bacterium]
MSITKHDALEYHRQGRPGKLEIRPTKPLTTQRDLALAYSPGVAEAVLEIDRDPMTIFELTAKANLVAVISNGTAILGLGDLGPEASKPVMEGKGVLFKRFADIDVFDIEINAKTPDEIVAAVRAVAPTFGGINLEDIKAPECFEVERRLRAELDIPVFHDDQHGTAIITGAALLNALEITNRDIRSLKVTIIGAGAAGIASAEFYVVLGVQRENITMVDVHGVVYAGREVDMDEYKGKFAHPTDKRTLADAIAGADVLLGLSKGGIVTPDMLKTMNPNPIIFALANPTPEVMPEVAREARPDAIIATGRSDFANQVNNVLGFPFLFRGALDVYARQINEAMKLAACHALARLAHEDVPDSVMSAYGVRHLKFGPEYLIPKPLDPRVLLWVAPAVASAAMQSGVARRNIDLSTYRDDLIRRQGFGQQFRYTLFNTVKAGEKKRIVFAEGEDPKIIRAAHRVEEEGIGTPILLGDAATIRAGIDDLGFVWEPTIVTPGPDTDPHYARYADELYGLRQRKGVNLNRAHSMLRSVSFYAPMMVRMGQADAYVSGLNREYPDVARPAFQVLGRRDGVKTVSGVYIIIVKNRVYFFTDTTINIDPDPEQLAQIAISAADFALSLGHPPRVAMLSFSNFGSVEHPLANKMRDAAALVNRLRPDLPVDGEMQADTAVVESLVNERFPFSRVKDANVLVFPGLASANIAYKLIARLTEAEAIGPVLLGTGAPVQVLQAGDDVESIVSLAAFAALDAQRRK